MDDLDLIKARVRELIGGYDLRGSLSSSEQQEVRELSMRFLGCNVPNCNCRNVYSDYLFLILNKLNNMKEIIKCNYKLKPGVLIHVGGEAYSNANLTDDVAAAYLAKYPNTTYFAVVPEVKRGRKNKEEVKS